MKNTVCWIHTPLNTLDPVDIDNEYDSDNFSDIDENNDSFTGDNVELFLLSFIIDVNVEFWAKS